MARFPVGLILSLVLLAPVAAAAPGSFQLRSLEPVLLEGAARVGAEGAGARVDHVGGVDAWTLRNVTGRLTFYEWDVATVERGDAQLGKRSYGEVTARPFDVADATLVVRLGGAESVFAVEAPAGSVHVAGHAVGEGRPEWLDEPELTESPGVLEAPVPDVQPAFPVGWAFLGDRLTTGGSLVGVPQWSAPVLDLSGSVTAKVFGGTVEFVDAAGRAHAIATGVVADDGAGPARTQRWSRLILEVDMGSSSIAVGAGSTWAVAAPSMVWHLDGELSWARASGELEVDGVRRRVEDASVAIGGAFAVTPARPGLAEPDVYRGSGDLEVVAIAGRPVATPAPLLSVAAPAALGALLAVGFAFFTDSGRAASAHVLAFFYTRLSRQGILDHPARRAIARAVSAAPGIHLRDLHRQVGGAWGPFVYHVATLENAGELRRERDGRYVAIYPAGGSPNGPQPRGETARRVMAALPRDGSSIGLPALREELGLSRQLLDHHLGELAERGLVVVDRAGPHRTARRGLLAPASGDFGVEVSEAPGKGSHP